jgi:DNA-binding response OmpR family regulator
MLSARTEETDRVVGLEVGADDYVTKPFSMRELLARVKDLLRRSGQATDAAATGAPPEPVVDPSGDLELDLHGRRLRCRGREVPLKPREFDLLAFLLRHPGQVFTREQLLDRVWAQGTGAYVGDIRTVDVHVRWLREKIERDPSKPRLLETVYGVGYRLRAPATTASPASRPAARA